MTPATSRRFATRIRWALVRQRLDDREIGDVSASVAMAFHSLPDAIRPGQRVCLAVSSRGIDRMAEVARAAVCTLKKLGADVFAVPELAHIEAVPAAQMWEREQELLKLARESMARLPLHQLDVLLLDYIGKDISGLGMDSNVVGRYYTGPTGSEPLIQRIVVRDLTADTEGNAVGIGMADVVLQQAVDRMDYAKTYMNCVTAKTPEGARVALTVPSDRAALDVALACCLNLDPAGARILRLRDTKHLEYFWASESLLPELRQTGHCEVLTPPEPIAFDAAGMLAQPAP